MTPSDELLSLIRESAQRAQELPVPCPTYPCKFCFEEYSWPAQDLHWHEQEKGWVCNECRCSEVHGEPGVSLKECIGPDIPRLTETLEVLIEALCASKRARESQYLAWANAGGPNQCEHGYSEGIACPTCDLKQIDAALSRALAIVKGEK
jgi:hypothetical protein